VKKKGENNVVNRHHASLKIRGTVGGETKYTKQHGSKLRIAQFNRPIAPYKFLVIGILQ
jgi:hypothetical protein